jgi:hypothetical protein
MKYLVLTYGLDDPVGCLDEREILYNTGRQDVIKEIISLTNDA